MVALAEDQKKQAVIQRELAWARAHLEGDLDLIAEIMAEDYRQRQADGSFKNKTEILASFKTGSRRWEIAASTHHHVQIAGQLAIVIGNWHGKGFNHGLAFDYRARFISIYRLENRSWKMLLDQSIPCSTLDRYISLQ